MCTCSWLFLFLFFHTPSFSPWYRFTCLVRLLFPCPAEFILVPFDSVTGCRATVPVVPCASTQNQRGHFFLSLLFQNTQLHFCLSLCKMIWNYLTLQVWSLCVCLNKTPIRSFLRENCWKNWPSQTLGISFLTQNIYPMIANGDL